MKSFLLAAVFAMSAGLALSSCDSSDSSTDPGANGGDKPIAPVYNKANFGIPWNTGVTYGTFTDSRDQQVYRTVKIGTQTWMAENLNYGEVGKCPGSEFSTTPGSADSCTKYGRLYSWSAVMQGDSSSSKSPSKVKGICPTGWHVPSDAEWQTLEIAIGIAASAVTTTGERGTTEGNKIKSTSGWSTNAGTDAYGFRAVPAGMSYPFGYFSNAGIGADWWTATENDQSDAWSRGMGHDFATVYRSFNSKWNGYSVRCTQD